MVVQPHNQAPTTQWPQHCQNHQIAKWRNTLVGNSHSLWLQMCGKKLTANSILNLYFPFEGPTVKHLVWAQWLGSLANEDHSKTNKQVWRVSPNVLWWLWWAGWERREDGLRKTQEDNMGGKTGSVDIGKEWLGKCEVERWRDERIRRAHRLNSK